MPLSPPAGGVNSKAVAAPIDDEDSTAKESSGDGEWENFYYDSYYEGPGGPVGSEGDGGDNDDNDDEDLLSPNSHHGLGPDTEPGLGGGSPGDYADMTEPPPFITEQQREEELAKISKVSDGNNNKEAGGGSRHKFDRGGEADEIIIVEEYVTTTTTRRPGRTSGCDGRSGVHTALLLVSLSATMFAFGGSEWRRR